MILLSNMAIWVSKSSFSSRWFHEDIPSIPMKKKMVECCFLEIFLPYQWRYSRSHPSIPMKIFLPYQGGFPPPKKKHSSHLPPVQCHHMPYRKNASHKLPLRPGTFKWRHMRIQIQGFFLEIWQATKITSTRRQGVIIAPTQTMHYEGENPWFLPYICIVWFPQDGSHLMINDPQPKLRRSLWRPKKVEVTSPQKPTYGSSSKAISSILC